MKLYMHPASTTCRPIMMFIADHALPVEQQVVDIMTGEQYGPAYAAINPNNLVPLLEDDGFRLTESSAILKYLADKIGSPAYPRELQQRARVNEAMDWFNTNFYRTFGYGLCYTQLLDPYKLPDPTGQTQLVAANKKAAERLLAILNDHIIGARPYLCGEEITLADYLASGILSLGDVIGCTFAAYPNVMRWDARMRTRPNWQAANGGVAAWADFARGPAYVTI
ncbi:MAG: glutathione S-transferase family protein [Stellaceae bacterium]